MASFHKIWYHKICMPFGILLLAFSMLVIVIAFITTAPIYSSQVRGQDGDLALLGMQLSAAQHQH
jgi:hypothetical protein